MVCVGCAADAKMNALVGIKTVDAVAATKALQLVERQTIDAVAVVSGTDEIDFVVVLQL